MATTSYPSNASSNPPVICVFCGASAGKSPAHLTAARELAQAMHAHGARLVYGGGTSGVMGEVAKTLVSLSGPGAVHGIIPRALLKYERPYENGVAVDGDQDAYDAQKHAQQAIDEATFGRTTVVLDMHTRKQMMAREVLNSGPGGGFVALSGGWGTLEELMEMTTWNQLGIHDRGIAVYNVEGYWDGLLQWVRTATESGFITEKNRGILVEGKTGEEVVALLREYQKSDERFPLTWEEK